MENVERNLPAQAKKRLMCDEGWSRLMLMLCWPGHVMLSSVDGDDVMWSAHGSGRRMSWRLVWIRAMIKGRGQGRMLIEEGVDQGLKKVETKEGCWWMNAG
jgi:hypothetical protein